VSSSAWLHQLMWTAEDRIIQVRVKKLLVHEDTVEGSKLMFGFLKATGLIQRLEQNKDCSGWVNPEVTLKRSNSLTG